MGLFRDKFKNVARKSCTFVAVFAFLTLGLNNTALNGKMVAQAAVSNAAAKEINSIDEARYLIENYYVDKVSDSVIKLNSIDSMVKGLNDPYSSYFTAKEYKDFVGMINNSFCGIGVYVDMVPQGVKITGVMENSPALEVGLKSGDIIVKADGHALAGLSSDVAVKYIRGIENTTVAIQVIRDGATKDFIVTRKTINAPTVEGKVVNSKTAYIRISSFGEETPKEFKNKLDELKKSNPSSYIIDLRNDGGGYTNSAYDIAGYFIGSNPVVKMVDGNNNVDVIKAIGHNEYVDKPTIFLVNENTASASEILSAAVKDYRKAFIIGNVTYGKGCAQNMFSLSDGSVLKITVKKFYSPNGNVIQKTGITPDLKVENSTDSLGVSLLLSGDSGNTSDKRGYMRVMVSGRYFDVNIDNAKKSDYNKAMRYIVDNCDKNEVYIGTENGWKKASGDYIFSFYK